MKPLSILVLLFMISSAPLHAQTTFAPAGCEWYHTMPTGDGVFHAYYSGDTVIMGTACRKVVQEANVLPGLYNAGLRVYNLPTLCVYNTTDTVFVYNTLFNRFTPLYVFNVSDGDTVTLPVMQPQPGSLNSAIHDSAFSFIVDSVRMKTYDTAALKTVYTHNIGNGLSAYAYTYGLSDATGAYAEKIGSIAGGPMPHCVGCIYVATESAQSAGQLRCYNDPALSVILTTDICGVPPAHVVQVSTQQEVSVYPHPASDIVNVSTGVATTIHITIIDMSGRAVVNHFNAGGNGVASIDVSQLNNGIYIMRLDIDHDAPLYSKIIIAH